MAFKRCIKILALGILIYLLLGIFVFFAQRSMLYHPRVCTSAHVDERLKWAKLERWTNANGQFIGLKRLSARQPARGTVLVTYGNGGAAIGCGRYATSIQKSAAFDVFILEYPGYQDRPGPPTQAALFDAADEALQALPAATPIYLVGESLGSGVACYLAGRNPDRVAGVALISPFNNLTDVAQSHIVIFPVKWLIRDRFASEDYLRHYHGKVGFTVDGKDLTVPERFGRRLYDSYAGLRKIWEFPQAGHIHIDRPDDFWNEVIRFWQANGQR